MNKRFKRYFNELKLSKENKLKIEKKGKKFFKNKNCPICKSKKFYFSEIPLEIKAYKKLNKRIYHYHNFMTKYCENCGYTQFFDLKSLNVNL